MEFIPLVSRDDAAKQRRDICIAGNTGFEYQDMSMYDLEQLVSMVIEASFQIHRKLGPGLLESAYETFLANKLKNIGLIVERQKSVPFVFEGECFSDAFRIDLFIENRLILELKSVEQILRVHKKQKLTYLRLMNLPLGLLLNFGSAYLKDGIKRVVNSYNNSAAP
ncbi:MAG: GxxExxY protein [Spirochaetales bacterium]|nr:GxxExxY protein [Spirochaetales bacterium]